MNDMTTAGKPIRDALKEAARRAEYQGYNGTAESLRKVADILPDSVADELRRLIR